MFIFIVRHSLVLTLLERLKTWFGLFNERARDTLVADWIRRLSVKAPRVGAPVRTLSGGNQQRVVLAKWLARNPRVLILDSPTVGVDINAKDGIYGVIAYSVSQRTNEIGIRIALGAAQSSIFKLVVGQAMTLVAVSVVIGLAGAFASTRLLSSLLFGVGAWDPFTFAGIVSLISVVAFIAAWLPARRAANVDPIMALRAE